MVLYGISKCEHVKKFDLKLPPYSDWVILNNVNLFRYSGG